MNAQKLILAAAVILALASACGLPAGGGSDQTDPVIEPTSADQAVSSPEEPAAGVEVSSALFLPLEAEIKVLTPESGNGPHPLFSWEPVAGAELYQLYIFETGGGAYWAWEGTETEIYLGGYESLPDLGIAGPILLEPMTWAVVALTEDGEFLASSRLAPIAP